MSGKVYILEVAAGETMKKQRRNKEGEGKTDYVKFRRLQAEENQLESVQFECWWEMNSDCWGGHHQGHGGPRPGSFRRIQKNGEWLQSAQKEALCISTKDFSFVGEHRKRKLKRRRQNWRREMELEDELSFKCSEITLAPEHPSKTTLRRAGLSFRIMYVYLYPICPSNILSPPPVYPEGCAIKEKA